MLTHTYTGRQLCITLGKLGCYKKYVHENLFKKENLKEKQAVRMPQAAFDREASNYCNQLPVFSTNCFDSTGISSTGWFVLKKVVLLDTDLWKCQEHPMQLFLTSGIISRPLLESFLLLERGKIVVGEISLWQISNLLRVEDRKTRCSLMFLIGARKLEGGDVSVNYHISRGQKGFGFLRDPNFLAPNIPLCFTFCSEIYEQRAVEGIQFPVHLCCATNHRPQAQSVSPSKIVFHLRKAATKLQHVVIGIRTE